MGGSIRECFHVVRDPRVERTRKHELHDVERLRARKGNAAESLSRVRRIALMLLKQEKTAKVGVKSRRKKAG